MPSTGVRPGNLPRQLTSFVGRERELQDLKELLGRSRLLTLTGPGGSGKTRLGLQLATEVASGFADGVSFVALAPVGNPHLVLSAIAQDVGLGDLGNRPLLDRLCRHLESTQVLLLLDNFEHLTAAAPAVAALLQARAELKIVVTSRGHHCTSAASRSMTSLPCEAGSARRDSCRGGRLRVGAAVHDRAQATWPGFVLDEANAAVIVEITQRPLSCRRRRSEYSTWPRSWSPRSRRGPYCSGRLTAAGL